MLLFPSRFVALIAVLLPGFMTSMRVGEEIDEMTSKDVMQFDGAFYKTNEGKIMKLSRQGVQYYEGKPTTYNFTRSDFHKEFVVTFSQPDGKDACREALFVSGETMPGLCSTGLFSQTRLFCDHLAPPNYRAYKGLEPKSLRGFGLEMEFVARRPTNAQRDYFHRLTTKSYGLDLHSPRGKVLAVKHCAKNITSPSDTFGTNCNDDSDCALDDYCLDCSKCRGSSWDCYPCPSDAAARGRKMCSKRSTCKSYRSGRECPMSLSLWNWMTDSSVVPLSDDEAKELGAGSDETEGYSFEVTSPAPPDALSGQKGFDSAVELLTVLRGMGVQAGPSQGMHVHINALNNNAPGKLLKHEGIIAVWLAYAKYQLVIDEMLSPGRIGNPYAGRLFFGDCKPNDGTTSCARNPCGCNRRFFNQMHEWMEFVLDGADRDDLSFCNYIIKLPGSERSQKPCLSKYPHQRYSQVNLVPVHKFGTIEFRGHSATYSITRVMRWTQFLVAFVEHFGQGSGARSILDAYTQSTQDKDYRRVQRHQERATFEELFNDLEGLVDPDTQRYYMTRKWERNVNSCAYPKMPKVEVVKECIPESSKDGKFVQAIFEKQVESDVTMKINVPALSRRQVVYPDREKNTGYISVLMPEGYTWKVKVTYKWNSRSQLYEAVDAIFSYSKLQLSRGKDNRNVFLFTYNPVTVEREFSEEQLEQHHRCCCIDQKCQWFSEDLLNNNRCPALTQKKDSHDMCVSKKSCNAITKLVNTGCVKASHSRRRTGPTQCSLIKDTAAFYNGTRCVDEAWFQM